MAARIAKIKRQGLEDSTLLLNTMIEKKQMTNVLFNWTIKNYSKLNRYVLYSKSAASTDFKWTFQLVKAKGTLFVSLSTNAYNRIVYFSIVSEDGSTRFRNPECLEINDGLYISEFCDTAITDPKNKYLTNDVLTMQCRYDTNPVETKISLLPYGQMRPQSDVHELCNNLKVLYLTSRFSDFVIKVKTSMFKVHKLILRARSNFFYELFEKDGEEFDRKELSVNTIPVIMHFVLLYLYNGHMQDLSVDSMIEVFHVSHTLRIPTLEHRCVKFLKENLSEDNVVEILTAATQYDVVELKNAAARFLSQSGRLLETKIMKDMLKVAQKTGA